MEVRHVKIFRQKINSLQFDLLIEKKGAFVNCIGVKVKIDRKSLFNSIADG